MDDQRTRPGRSSRQRRRAQQRIRALRSLLAKNAMAIKVLATIDEEFSDSNGNDGAERTLCKPLPPDVLSSLREGLLKLVDAAVAIAVHDSATAFDCLLSSDVTAVAPLGVLLKLRVTGALQNGQAGSVSTSSNGQQQDDSGVGDTDDDASASTPASGASSRTGTLSSRGSRGSLERRAAMAAGKAAAGTAAVATAAGDAQQPAARVPGASADAAAQAAGAAANGQIGTSLCRPGDGRPLYIPAEGLKKQITQNPGLQLVLVGEAKAGKSTVLCFILDPENKHPDLELAPIACACETARIWLYESLEDAEEGDPSDGDDDTNDEDEPEPVMFGEEDGSGEQDDLGWADPHLAASAHAASTNTSTDIDFEIDLVESCGGSRPNVCKHILRGSDVAELAAAIRSLRRGGAAIEQLAREQPGLDMSNVAVRVRLSRRLADPFNGATYTIVDTPGINEGEGQWCQVQSFLHSGTPIVCLVAPSNGGRVLLTPVLQLLEAYPKASVLCIASRCDQPFMGSDSATMRDIRDEVQRRMLEELREYCRRSHRNSNPLVLPLAFPTEKVKLTMTCDDKAVCVAMQERVRKELTALFDRCRQEQNMLLEQTKGLRRLLDDFDAAFLQACAQNPAKLDIFNNALADLDRGVNIALEYLDKQFNSVMTEIFSEDWLEQRAAEAHDKVLREEKKFDSFWRLRSFSKEIGKITLEEVTDELKRRSESLARETMQVFRSQVELVWDKLRTSILGYTSDKWRQIEAQLIKPVEENLRMRLTIGTSIYHKWMTVLELLHTASGLSAENRAKAQGEQRTSVVKRIASVGREQVLDDLRQQMRSHLASHLERSKEAVREKLNTICLASSVCIPAPLRRQKFPAFAPFRSLLELTKVLRNVLESSSPGHLGADVEISARLQLDIVSSLLTRLHRVHQTTSDVGDRILASILKDLTLLASATTSAAAGPNPNDPVHLCISAVQAVVDMVGLSRSGARAGAATGQPAATPPKALSVSMTRHIGFATNEEIAKTYPMYSLASAIAIDDIDGSDAEDGDDHERDGGDDEELDSRRYAGTDPDGITIETLMMRVDDIDTRMHQLITGSTGSTNLGANDADTTTDSFVQTLRMHRAVMLVAACSLLPSKREAEAAMRAAANSHPPARAGSYCWEREPVERLEEALEDFCVAVMKMPPKILEAFARNAADTHPRSDSGAAAAAAAAAASSIRTAIDDAMEQEIAAAANDLLCLLGFFAPPLCDMNRVAPVVSKCLGTIFAGTKRSGRKKSAAARKRAAGLEAAIASRAGVGAGAAAAASGPVAGPAIQDQPTGVTLMERYFGLNPHIDVLLATHDAGLFDNNVPICERWCLLLGEEILRLGPAGGGQGRDAGQRPR